VWLQTDAIYPVPPTVHLFSAVKYSALDLVERVLKHKLASNGHISCCKSARLAYKVQLIVLIFYKFNKEWKLTYTMSEKDCTFFLFIYFF